MRLVAYALIAALAPLPAPAFAQRIENPAADIAAAFSRRVIQSPFTSRALAVAPDGRELVYVVREHVSVDPAAAETFLPSGAPVAISGSTLLLADIEGGPSRRLCPAGANDWNPAWSPDGRSIAFYSDRDGRTGLWLYEKESGQCRKLTDRPVKSLPWAHDEARWSPDGRTLFFPEWPAEGPGSAASAQMPAQGERPATGAAGGVTLLRHDPAAIGQAADAAPPSRDEFDRRCGMSHYVAASIGSVYLEDGQVRAVVSAVATGTAAGAARHLPTPYFRLSASGRWLTYFSTGCTRAGETHRLDTGLYAVPASGGEPLLIAGGLRTPFGGDEFSLNYRWSPRSDELVYMRDGALWKVEFGANGPGQPIRLGEELGALAPALHWYTEDGAMLLVGTDPVSTGRGNDVRAFDMNLALVPMAGGPATRIAVDQSRWAIQRVLNRDERVLWQSGPRVFLIEARDKVTGENVILSVDWQRGSIAETWRGRGQFRSLVPSRSGLVGIYQDFRTPPDIYALSSTMGERRRISEIEPGLERAATSEVELFDTVVPRHDGTLHTVRTAVLMPPGARRGDRVPAIIWFYPGSDVTAHLAEFGAPVMGDPAYLFTSRGYAIVLANVAIGPGEERGHVIDEIMDSLMPQVHRAADLGYVDIERLALRGQSFGAFATAAVTARTTLFRAAIPSSGPYDLGGAYGEVRFYRGEALDGMRWFETSQPRLGATLWEDPARYLANFPDYLADRIRTPMLILQGTEDSVGSREATKLYAALRRLNRPVELALYEGGGHAPSAWITPHAIDQAARTLEFLKRHLGEGWTASSGRQEGTRPAVNRAQNTLTQ